MSIDLYRAISMVDRIEMHIVVEHDELGFFCRECGAHSPYRVGVVHGPNCAYIGLRQVAASVPTAAEQVTLKEAMAALDRERKRERESQAVADKAASDAWKDITGETFPVGMPEHSWFDVAKKMKAGCTCEMCRHLRDTLKADVAAAVARTSAKPEVDKWGHDPQGVVAPESAWSPMEDGKRHVLINRNGSFRAVLRDGTIHRIMVENISIDHGYSIGEYDNAIITYKDLGEVTYRDDELEQQRLPG